MKLSKDSSIVITKREFEVLQELTTGKSNNDIANSLNVTERTIKAHITNILRKLKASDRTHAVVIAIKRGLVKL
jgi:two-component system NarL family response regulator